MRVLLGRFRLFQSRYSARSARLHRHRRVVPLSTHRVTSSASLGAPKCRTVLAASRDNVRRSRGRINDTRLYRGTSLGNDALKHSSTRRVSSFPLRPSSNSTLPALRSRRPIGENTAAASPPQITREEEPEATRAPSAFGQVELERRRSRDPRRYPRSSISFSSPPRSLPLRSTRSRSYPLFLDGPTVAY